MGVSHPQYLVAVGEFSVRRQKGERGRKRREMKQKGKGVKGKTTENEKRKREREHVASLLSDISIFGSSFNWPIQVEGPSAN